MHNMHEHIYVQSNNTHQPVANLPNGTPSASFSMARVYAVDETRFSDNVSDALSLIAGHVRRTDSGSEFLACLSCACKLLGSDSTQKHPQQHVNIPKDLATVLEGIPFDAPDTKRAVRASMLRSAACCASAAALVRELLTGDTVHRVQFNADKRLNLVLATVSPDTLSTPEVASAFTYIFTHVPAVLLLNTTCQ
jgi:hypothetical protein